MGVPSANVAAEATAMLDRDVIGFRPEGDIPIPLAPIALLSDPAGLKRCSWEYLVENENGPDEFHYDPDRHCVTAGADGLHEMPVTLNGEDGKGNACLLRLGVERCDEIGAQVREGITTDELRNLPGGRIALDDDGRFLAPTQPVAGGSESRQLFDNLEGLAATGEARVWPLFQGFDPETGAAVVTRFVAARVVRMGGDGGFVLQPCMVCTATAVTDPRRTVGPNPYICKIRLVE